MLAKVYSAPTSLIMQPLLQFSPKFSFFFNHANLLFLLYTWCLHCGRCDELSFDFRYIYTLDVNFVEKGLKKSLIYKAADQKILFMTWDDGSDFFCIFPFEITLCLF